jgi:hypothetical protein
MLKIWIALLLQANVIPVALELDKASLTYFSAVLAESEGTIKHPEVFVVMLSAVTLAE